MGDLMNFVGLRYNLSVENSVVRGQRQSVDG